MEFEIETGPKFTYSDHKLFYEEHLTVFILCFSHSNSQDLLVKVLFNIIITSYTRTQD